MAAKGSNTGDSGGRNKTLAIVAVVLLGAAGAWLYFGRGEDLEEAVKEQVAAKQAANPTPPPAAAEDSGVAVPDENKPEATADADQPTDEASPEAGPAKKKPLQAKAGRSIK